MNSIRRGPLLLLILLLAALWFGTLEFRRLVNPDEGRYAEIPREMAASGDWITPRLNDLKYFDKPPLQYWMTAAAYKTFGEHHWTARLWPALTGFAGILLTGYVAAALFNPTAGIIAAAVLASSLLWTLIGHMNSLDMSVSFFLAAAVFALCLSENAARDPAKSRRWRDGAWALLALAVLSKGLIGIALPAATVVIYSIWQRDWGLLWRIRPLRGIGIMLLITAPWFIAVSLANPEFARFFFIHEHFERFLTKAHGRYQPPWYFIPILLMGMLPWTVSLVSALREGIKSPASRNFSASRFLLVWCVFVFFFFSISNSKLASYILPMFPALAVLIGVVLAKQIDRSSLRWHLLPAVICGALGLFLVPLAKGFAGDDLASLAGYKDYETFLFSASLVMLVAGIAGMALAKKRGLAAILIVAFGGHIAAQLIFLGHDKVGYLKSSHDIALTLRGQVPADVPFYSVNTYDQSLQFYIKRPTTMVAYRDELAFGIEQEPHKFIADLAGFEKAWRAAPQAWALMPPETYENYRQSGLPMFEVTRDPRRVIVRKP